MHSVFFFAYVTERLCILLASEFELIACTGPHVVCQLTWKNLSWADDDSYQLFRASAVQTAASIPRLSILPLPHSISHQATQLLQQTAQKPAKSITLCLRAMPPEQTRLPDILLIFIIRKIRQMTSCSSDRCPIIIISYFFKMLYISLKC